MNEELLLKLLKNSLIVERYEKNGKTNHTNEIIYQSQGDHPGWLEMSRHNSRTNPYFSNKKGVRK